MNVSSQQRVSKRFGHLEARIGYQFCEYENLERALTHASVRKKSDNNFHYQRLEFLGDRVLGLVVASLLFTRYPSSNEGELSLRLNELVKGKTLAEIADEMGLHEFIRTGGDLKELTSKRMRSVRADVLEALIGSIYLDGGLESASDFIKRFWNERLDRVGTTRRDSKTSLQEWAHAERLGTPRYKEIERSGPDHEPMFTVSVMIEGIGKETGSGRSKRVAEQKAAKAMLIAQGIWQKDAE